MQLFRQPGRPSRKSETSLVPKTEKMEFETPSNSETQVELTSSGRRRIRPMKYNDFAGIKPKSASSENLVMRHPTHELETPVKESRRKRADREIIEMGSPLKGLSDTKRVRCHTSTAKNDERTSKRKISLDDNDIEMKSSKKRRLARESISAKTPPRQTRETRSITAGTTAREDVTPEIEKTRKRRRTTGAQSIDRPIEMENIRIKEEPRTSQQEIIRFGKLTSATERSHRDTRLFAQTEIKSEHIEPPRRGRKPKQPVFESDTQSESTDAGRKFSARSQRISRIESNYSVERRSSRNLSMQEQPNSPMTGASTEPSGDECLRPSDKRMSRRYSRRSKNQHTEPEVMQIPSADNQSDDDIDSVIEEAPLSSRSAKTRVADIFAKAAKRAKEGRKWNTRDTSALQNKSHNHRTSHRIAAAAAVSKCKLSASSEHSASTHSHGGTSSDDQQISNKKQMTLPEMMQIQKAKHSAAEQMYV